MLDLSGKELSHSSHHIPTPDNENKLFNTTYLQAGKETDINI